MNPFQIKPITLSLTSAVGKLSKIAITGLVVANVIRDKLPIFVIGKAKKPQCFKNMKFSACRYRNQQKSSKRWTRNLFLMEEKLLWWSTIALPILTIRT